MDKRARGIVFKKTVPRFLARRRPTLSDIDRSTIDVARFAGASHRQTDGRFTGMFGHGSARYDGGECRVRPFITDYSLAKCARSFYDVRNAVTETKKRTAMS